MVEGHLQAPALEHSKSLLVALQVALTVGIFVLSKVV